MERNTIGKKAKECSQVGISILNTEKVTPSQRAKGSRATSRGTSWGRVVPAERPASTRSLREARGACPAWVGQHRGQHKWAAGPSEEDKDFTKGQSASGLYWPFSGPVSLLLSKMGATGTCAAEGKTA